MAPTAELLAALEKSHARLAGALRDQDPEAQSYADDWSVGQVASHLGSGAEIFTLLVDAGAKGDAPPETADFQAIWARWDAKPAADQARDSVTADRAFLDRVAALTAEEAQRWRIEFIGQEQDLAALLGMRLGEHAAHTWDIVVVGDPTSTVAGDAAALLIDSLPRVVSRGGKPTPEQHRVRVTTTAPDRTLLLELSAEGASLAPAQGDTDAELRLPAEALLRLVYGRLDPDHTPGSVETNGIDLDVLRTAFPGF